MKIIVAIVCGVVSSIFVTAIGIWLISGCINVPNSIQLWILPLLALPGSFVAGFISQKNGWFVGSVTMVAAEIFYAMCSFWFVTNSFAPSSTQKFTTYYMINREIQLYICSGIGALAGALIGLLGEKIGRWKKMQ